MKNFLKQIKDWCTSVNRPYPRGIIKIQDPDIGIVIVEVQIIADLGNEYCRVNFLNASVPWQYQHSIRSILSVPIEKHKIELLPE